MSPSYGFIMGRLGLDASAHSVRFGRLPALPWKVAAPVRRGSSISEGVAPFNPLTISGAGDGD